MHLSHFLKVTSVLAVTMVCTVGVVSGFAAAEKKAPAAKVDAVFQGIPEVVAKVNGAPIKAIVFLRAKKALEKQQLSAEKRKELNELAIAQVVSTELLYQAGKKLTIKDLDKQVKDKLAATKARFSKPEDYAKSLKAADMDENEMKDYIRRTLIVNNLIQSTIASRIKVSDEDCSKFYENNKDKFTHGEMVRVSHILCSVASNASAADKKKASEKAEKLRAQLVKGADFAKLAKANSNGSNSKNGGDLNFISKGQMDPAFEKAAFSLKKGAISNVVETKLGYHIIKVTDTKKAGTESFKEVRPEIVDYLKDRQLTVAVSKFVTELRKNGTVETFVK